MRWELIRQPDGSWHLIRVDGAQTADASPGVAVIVATGFTFGDDERGLRDRRAVVTQAAARYLAQQGRTAAGEDPDPAGRWRSPVLIPEGVDTSDGRFIREGAMDWREPPLPLMLQTVNEGGHYGAELAGSMIDVGRDDSSQIYSAGTLDASEAGQRALEVLGDRQRYGISADLGQMDVEYECVELDGDGYCVAERMEVTRGELIGATMTPFPAFAESYIELDGGDAAEAPAEEPATEPAEDDAEASAQAASAQALVLMAAGIPTDPPAGWFDDPELSGPTAMTVEDSGRVYGHAALWGSCHVGRTDTCLEPPHSETDYAHFRVGEVRPDGCDCDAVATGVITLATGHASISDAHAAAFEHYANSGHAVADVACGEDAHGIWFAGALRPTVTPEQIRELRGSVISGDWRRIGGNLELIAMLAVNTPGYPVPRTQARIAASAGREHATALVAAGASPLAARVSPRGDTARLDRIERELARQGRIVDPLRPAAARALVEEITAGAAPQA